MQKYIEQLKQKPEAVRKQIALVVAIVGSGIVFLFWISTFSLTTTNTENILPPLDSIRDNAQATYNDLKTNISNVQTQEIQPEVEVSPESMIQSETTEDVQAPVDEDQPINY